jgi:polysaccharide export outer membrane protein
MNRIKLISSIIFLMFNALLFAALQPHVFAQGDISLQQLSAVTAQQNIGSSAFTSLNLGSEAQKYYDFASDSQKLSLMDGLSSDERASIFEGLSEYERQSLFRILSDRERLNLFGALSDYYKREIFQTLTDIDKKNLFKLIDDADKQILLDVSSYLEKKNLIENLPDNEKGKWIAIYPDLEGDISFTETSGTGDAEASALSDMERILSGQFPTGISRTLSQFGYNFFSQGPSSYVPERAVPVGPNYVIGPDDRFTINLWGRTEEMYYVTVSRDGRITLPRLGTLEVAGLTLSELKTFLLNKFKEYYPDFEMSITMGTLRSVEVFVIGELENPGTYSLNSLSTGISALFASGGPTKNGSLRNIKVFDQGKLVTTIDLYEFFIKGTKENDIRLRQGYTIFIPVIGPVAGVAGHVKRPAIYEMKGDQTIGEIIELAGGVLPTGHLQNVVVERIIGNEKRVIKSFNLDPEYEESDLNLKTTLKDGDVIKIYPVYNRMEEVVYLEGHVKYPREYELTPGMRLADIVSSFDCLLPEPYLPQAEIIRSIPPDFHIEIVEFNLGSLLAGDSDQNLLLQNQDRIKIYGKWEKTDIPEVTINGALREPGVYRLYEGMTIKDLIFQAGNVTRNAYMEKADLTRIIPSSTGTDILKLSFSPQRALEGTAEDNPVLQENDEIFIREIPEYTQALDRKVILEGEFMFPGTYTFSEGERLSSIIQRAGGLTEEAYPLGAIFRRESVREIQKSRQAEYISRLEKEVLTLSVFAQQTALDTGEAAIVQQALSTQQNLIKKLKEAEPTGRMIINIPEILLMPSADIDVEVRPGDHLIIAKRPDSVNVMGEVYNPNALLFEKGRTVDYYLSLVGGPTDNANKKQAYIIKADGSVISKRQDTLGFINWDIKNQRWRLGGGFYSTALEPGDTIIIPKKVTTISWLKTLKDTTSVIYQIAVSAGVLHELFTD